MIELVAKSEAAKRPGWSDAFCALPEQVRQGNARVGLLPASLWNQFLQNAPAGAAEFWVAYDGDVAVGRIGANLTPTAVGVVGFFETNVAHANAATIATLLLDAAVHWCAARGMESVVGPMNFNTWFSYRLRTDEDDRAFAWEPQNPREYVTYFERSGFSALEKYHSVGTAGLKAFHDASQAAYGSALQDGYTFRAWDATALLDKEVPILHRLSNEGFKGNFLFQPLPLEMFRQLYVPIANKFDFTHCFFAMNPAKQEVGFTFAFVEADSLIMKSVTVVESERGKGLSNALMHLAAAEALKRNISHYISALMREGNRSESYSKKGNSLWTHRYVLFSRPLP